ncbi:MAG: glutamate synthase subunit beta [Bifidobacteriaceae bacterium]|jgi:glutamate synthase (NADPH/NADH) small chain|nr:glutamate synthase subunit beta [Bifidobacteriaceae bacterium]
MADPKGFLKVTSREIMKDRPARERILDFNDTHAHIPESETLRIITKQSSRCMDCGIAFCHAACPLHNLIPEFNDFLWRGDYESAFNRLELTNNFPEFTGKLCPALCEASCVLGINNPAVTIKQDEAFIADYVVQHGLLRPKTVENSDKTHKKVAVIGSGPAGLACAQQLTRAGHDVTVYEKSDALGGLLRYGVPNFKLEKHYIDRRIQQMEQEGTHFVTSTQAGKDVSWQELRANYDALAIAIGTGIPNDLAMKGRDLEGIHFALEYLTASNKVTNYGAQAGNTVPDTLNAKGKNVLIIGGGDTGSDCLGTALRQGAAHVTSLQVLAKPPAQRPYNQPWPIYPSTYNPSTSMQEGGEYLWSTTVTKFLPDSTGKHIKTAVLEGVNFENGKITPIPNTKREIPVDIALISVGFKSPKATELADELGVALTDRGALARDTHFMTNIDGVFAGGDAARGQSLVVWAIAEGRSMASEINEYLGGRIALGRSVEVNDMALRLVNG